MKKYIKSLSCVLLLAILAGCGQVSEEATEKTMKFYINNTEIPVT